ncbi:MAG: hypothetical protein JNL82_19360 [Myxococcales bacterium]|nr:hypothetical protein [Myxococcales bacterium]
MTRTTLVLLPLALALACGDKGGNTPTGGLTNNNLSDSFPDDDDDDDGDTASGDPPTSAGDTSSSPGSDPSSEPTTPATTDVDSTTSTSTTASPSEPLTTTDPSDPSDPSDASDPSTSTTATSESTLSTGEPETTGGEPYGQCGWESTNKYYACAADGATPGAEDPEGMDPIQCPDGLVEGGACSDANGPVNAIGCCTLTGELYYCDTQSTLTIIYQDCGS